MTGLLLLDCFAVKKLRGATTTGGNCLLLYSGMCLGGKLLYRVYKKKRNH